MAANKKKDNEESEVWKKDLSRANWSKDTLHIFCDLCIQHIERAKVNRGALISQRMQWKLLEVEFQKRTNLAYDKRKLKNKWDWMKSKWSLWKALKGNETEIGWDREKGTISASEDWWNKKIEENMHFKVFKEEGIEPELEIKMDVIFGASVAQEMLNTPVMDSPQDIQCEKETVCIPSSPPSLNVGNAPYNCNDEKSENSAFNHSETNIKLQEVSNGNSPILCPTPLQFVEHEIKERGRKRVSEFGYDASESNKSSRTECTMVKILMEKLDTVVEVATKRNIKQKEAVNCEASTLVDSSHTLVESLAKLVSLPGLIPGSSEFCFACTLIEDPRKRTILHGIPDDYSRLQWIKFLYEEYRHRFNLEKK